MPLTPAQVTRFLKSVHPYDALPLDVLETIAPQLDAWEVEQDFSIYDLGDALPGLFLIYEGQVEITDENDVVVSHLGLRNSFGERGLLRDGKAVTSARADAHSILLVVPSALFSELELAADAQTLNSLTPAKLKLCAKLRPLPSTS